MIRPAGTAVWLRFCKSKTEKFLEIDFNKVLDEIKSIKHSTYEMSDDCYKKILEIIEIKRSMRESDYKSERIECIDEWFSKVMSLQPGLFENNTTLEPELRQNYDNLLQSVLNVSSVSLF